MTTSSKSIHWLLAVASVTMLLYTPRVRADDKREEAKRALAGLAAEVAFGGKYQVEEYVVDGEQQDIKKMEAKIVGKDFLLTLTKEKKEHKEFIIRGFDAEKETITLLDHNGALLLKLVDKENDLKKLNQEGIYKSTKDSLELCFSEIGGKRPDGFKSTKGSGRTLIKLKVIKE